MRGSRTTIDKSVMLKTIFLSYSRNRLHIKNQFAARDRDVDIQRLCFAVIHIRVKIYSHSTSVRSELSMFGPSESQYLVQICFSILSSDNDSLAKIPIL